MADKKQCPVCATPLICVFFLYKEPYIKTPITNSMVFDHYKILSQVPFPLNVQKWNFHQHFIFQKAFQDSLSIYIL